MSRDQWAERTARDLIQSTWRPGEDVTERRMRVIAETAAEIERLEIQRQVEQDDLEVLAELVMEKLQVEREIAARRLAAADQILVAAKERRRARRGNASRRNTRPPRDRESARDDVISCHVKVDPEAWQILRNEARRRRATLMRVVGTALSEEAAKFAAGEVRGAPSGRRRRSPAEDSPSPTDRVIRVETTPETWMGIAEAASTTGLTGARYAGEVIEAVAHELGWRIVG